MKDGVVLDSWAVMAWLKNQEPAAGRVRKLLDGAGKRKLVMSIVNLGEVYYLTVKLRDPSYGMQVLEALRARVRIISASDELVMAAAGLKSRFAISYADAFAAATAIACDLPLMTGDAEFLAMAGAEPDFRVEWIGAERK